MVYIQGQTHTLKALKSSKFLPMPDFSSQNINMNFWQKPRWTAAIYFIESFRFVPLWRDWKYDWKEYTSCSLHTIFLLKILPAAVASVSFGFVSVRDRVRLSEKKIS